MQRAQSPRLGFSSRQTLCPRPLGRGDHACTVQTLAQKFEQKAKAQEQAEAARLQTEQARGQLEAEIKRLQDEIAAVKKANQAAPDTHNYNEEQTRDAFIDLLLHEAGWPLDQPRDREYPAKGMPNNAGEGFVDYVLWGDDGKPLALVEAKRTKRTPASGSSRRSSMPIALRSEFGQRPVIFYSNGYEHWIWDDAGYPPRAVQGFLKKDELMLLHQRRTAPQIPRPTDVDQRDCRALLSDARHPPHRRSVRAGQSSARRCSSWRPVRARPAPSSRLLIS